MYIKIFCSTFLFHRQITDIKDLQTDCTARPPHAYTPAAAEPASFQYSTVHQQHNPTSPPTAPTPQQLTTCSGKRKETICD